MSRTNIWRSQMTKLPFEIGQIGEEAGVDNGVGRDRTEEGLKVVKERRRKLRGCLWVLFMEGSDQLLGVSQVGSWFPGGVAGAVAFPLDKVLKLALEEAGVQNLFDFVFFFAVDLNRLGSRRFVDAIVPIGERRLTWKTGWIFSEGGSSRR